MQWVDGWQWFSPEVHSSTSGNKTKQSSLPRLTPSCIVPTFPTSHCLKFSCYLVTFNFTCRAHHGGLCGTGPARIGGPSLPEVKPGSRLSQGVGLLDQGLLLLSSPSQNRTDTVLTDEEEPNSGSPTELWAQNTLGPTETLLGAKSSGESP